MALDKFGKPTTDAKKALKGVQLPIGEFKGSGLAWMVDILSGVWTGANHAGKVKDPFDDFSGPQNVGHVFIALKADLFVKNFKKRIQSNIKIVKKLPKIKSKEKILFPGETKFKKFKTRSKKDIIIPNNIQNDLNLLLS